MKRIALGLLMVFFVLECPVFAKRGPAPVVAPVMQEGIRYEATHNQMGVVEGFDVKTGEKVWEKKVYEITIDPSLEPDVQWVLIKELKIEPYKGKGVLVIIDERGRTYQVELDESKLNEVRDKVELEFNYEIDSEGGKYFLINDELPFRRFSDFRTWIDTDKIKRLTLVPEQEFQWKDSFLEERNRMIEIARKNKYVVNFQLVCLEKCSCDEGMTSTVYDYQDKDVMVKTSKDQYKLGEEASFTVSNSADFDKYFQVAAVEKWEDGQWKEIVWNAPCHCGGPCDYVGYVESDKEFTQAWDQTYFDESAYTCSNTPSGRYRFHIAELYGYIGDEGCATYHSSVYSNEFEIN